MSNYYSSFTKWPTTLYNNVLIRSGEAPAIGWSRNMFYSGFNILHRSVIRRQIGFAARITRTLYGSIQPMANSTKFRTLACVTGTLFVTVLLVAVYFMRSHVRAAKSIGIGYSPTAVHDVLGEPTAVIKSIENLNRMFPPTSSYRFRTLDGNWIDPDTIQFQVADWFEHGSAGYLVIYENGGVVRTIWGGT